MIDPSHPLGKLLQKDRRYKVEAYAFVFEALNYAHEKLGWGAPAGDAQSEQEKTEDAERERHLTGQQLCEAIRLLALEQFGFMAKTVLNNWGVTSTGDLGEIVFNLIKTGQMKKTDDDKRSDFENVFDFDEGLTESFRIKMNEQ
jgi:uncharacterized repeat protein (TIGR04138 family)